MKNIQSFSVFIALIFGLVTCPVMGQDGPKPVTEKEYHLWGSLNVYGISDKGNWAHYNMHYDSGKDTLFITHTKTAKSYSFPRATVGSFAYEHTFACRRNDTLILLDLKTGKQINLAGVLQHQFAANGLHLATLEKGKGENQNLCIRDIQGKLLATVNNVSEWSWNHTKDAVAYTAGDAVGYTVGIIHLGQKYVREEISANRNPFQTLVWQPSGSGIAFFTTDASARPALQYFDGQKLRMLGPDLAGLPGMAISPDQNIALSISKDGRKVFFGVRSTVAIDSIPNPSSVEVWNGNDKELYPLRTERASAGHPQLLAAWWPATGKVVQVSTAEMPWVMLTGDGNHALVSDPLKYEPDYKFIADMDYWLVNIETGERSLFLERHSGWPNWLGVSPDGRFINYYRNLNWYGYDLHTGTHTNLTAGIKAQWESSLSNPGAQNEVWGLAGYSKDGKWVLLYEFYDIWAASVDGKTRKKLTPGREDKIRFRFAENGDDFWLTNYDGAAARSRDLSGRQFVSARDMVDGTSGYHVIEDGKIRPFAMGDGKISRIKQASKSAAVVFQHENFNTPPQIAYKMKGQSHTVYKSNLHHSRFTWGRSEMIHYKGLRDSVLNGALFYPVGYKPGVKYPMVVFIYEGTVSQPVHEYVNPGLYNLMGYNAANLTAKGYFVLRADINYTPGDPAHSAVQGVTAAVNTVIEKGLVDSGRIGLIGHSFAGYEANFIATQTGIFSTIVSGASVADIVMQYFSVSKEYNTADLWRHESQQFRMVKPFYDSREAYLRNSPIMHADGVTAPILLWTGGKDRNVLPEQSSAFYVALRRLQKKCIMLVYPDDVHSLHIPKNQQDLTTRTEQWFGHFLKDEPADWITQGTQCNTTEPKQPQDIPNKHEP